MNIEILRISTKVAEDIQLQTKVLATLETLQATLDSDTRDTFSMGYPGTYIKLDKSVVKVLLLLQRDLEQTRLKDLQETFANL